MSFFRQSVLFEGLLGIAAMFAGFLFGYPFWQNCRFDITALIYTAAVLLPLLAAYFFLNFLPFWSVKKVDQIVRLVIQREMSDFSVWQFIVVAAAAGFGEEFLFRGLLQGGLTDYFGQLYQIAVILFVSILFGLAHSVTKLYAFLAFLISLYFCYVYVWTQNLLVPVAVHGFYDLFVFLLIRYEKKATPNK
ncbi:hypothetical protein FACS189419_03490 [Planctomycetales bacterium]|nr:hypothetical protein FACS189419_03490 [Planctomycetales bacterium]